jgi:hypothetical protein
MKKAFPIALMLLGLVFLAVGVYTMYRGFDARDQVRAELVAQNIVTPGDASIPNTQVTDIPTARSMAEIIDAHARTSTGGLGFAEMGRFMSADGDPAGTSNPDEALLGEDGQPVPNALRNVAFQSSALQTSLYTSIMAFEVATLVIGLGLMIIVLGLAVGGLGVALGALAIPTLGEKLHVEPIVAEHDEPKVKTGV